MTPSVTVVIPCYNSAAFLRETLASVLRQTHPPAEVIVVDDGSTDASAAIAGTYGPPVRLIRQENQGPGAARNRGIEEASGDWIAFVDSDDTWAPKKLEKQLEVAEPDVVCVHTEWRGAGTRQTESHIAGIPVQQRYTIQSILLGGWHFNTSSLMVRASLPVRFPVRPRHGEDKLYFVQVTRLGRAVLVPEILTETRFHASSLTATPGARALWYEAYEKWFRQNGDRLDPQDVNGMRERMTNDILQEAWPAYWRRDWKAFRRLREYLATYGAGAEVDRLLARKMYPFWLYIVKDLVDRCLTPFRSEERRHGEQGSADPIEPDRG